MHEKTRRRTAGRAAFLALALASPLAGCSSAPRPTTGAELAAAAGAPLSAPEQTVRDADCRLPGTTTADGAPASSPVRVRLEEQRVLTEHSVEHSRTGEVQFIQFRPLPFGGVGAADACGFGEIAFIGKDAPLYGGSRVRPGVDLAADYPATIDRVRRNKGRLQVLPAGDYVVVPGVKLPDARKYAQRLSEDGYASPDRPLLVQSGYAFIPVKAR